MQTYRFRKKGMIEDQAARRAILQKRIVPKVLHLMQILTILGASKFVPREALKIAISHRF